LHSWFNYCPIRQLYVNSVWCGVLSGVVEMEQLRFIIIKGDGIVVGPLEYCAGSSFECTGIVFALPAMGYQGNIVNVA
jgi:hypothetical protein